MNIYLNDKEIALITKILIRHHSLLNKDLNNNGLSENFKHSICEETKVTSQLIEKIAINVLNSKGKDKVTI